MMVGGLTGVYVRLGKRVERRKWLLGRMVGLIGFGLIGNRGGWMMSEMGGEGWRVLGILRRGEWVWWKV